MTVLSAPSELYLPLFFILGFCSAFGAGANVGSKADMPDTPVVSYSPPEGNTTFIDGTTWCVASPSAGLEDLQDALDWACGPGLTDCSGIQPGGPCYLENNLVSVASFAFNTYYQANGDSPIACNFGGTAMITTSNPSYGTCQFQTSGNTNENSSSPALPNPGMDAWVITGILLFIHLMTTTDRREAWFEQHLWQLNAAFETSTKVFVSDVWISINLPFAVTHK